MGVLVVVGVGLAVFGSLVLLKFPDRPGGRLVFRGVEVSSAGAGLPLIVLGVATVVLAIVFVDGNRGDGSSEVSTNRGTATTEPDPASSSSPTDVTSPPVGTPPSGCFADYFASVPSDRVGRLEAGAQDVDLITASQPKDEPFGVLLTDFDEPVAAVTARYFASSGIFRILSVVDVACRPIDSFSTEDSPDKHVVRNWGALRIAVGGSTYAVDFGGSDQYIRLDFSQIAAR